MTPAQSNHHLLDFWAGAYDAFGEAALLPLGLSPADIDTLLTVEPAILRHWAERSDSIVRPRPSLLPALHAWDQARIAAFLAGHGRGNATVAVRLLRAVNRHVLALWRQAAGDDEAAARVALGSTDRAALMGADELALRRWMRLPIALAEPRPGLLPDLLAREEPHLAAFLNSLGPTSTAP